MCAIHNQSIEVLLSISKRILLFYFVVVGFKAESQDYYITTPDANSLNTVYRLDVGYCDFTQVPYCNNGETFTDIALDKDDNLWYVTDNLNLYSQKLNDTVCQYIGRFSDNGLVNSLVADPAGVIYASGFDDNGNELFKYDGSFSVVGKLPDAMVSSGDLFFYENRLFLTCANTDSSFIAELTLPDLTQSYSYIKLNSPAYGGFSIVKNGISESYIMTTDNNTSALVKLDMLNRLALDTVCTYPFSVYGAASYYNPEINNTELSACEAYIPNAFTPNDDGKNDGFHVLFPLGCSIQDFQLDIFNRWGTEVFTTTNISAKWDGNFKGEKQNMDVYMYQLKYRAGTNGKIQYRKGDVTLVR